MGPTLENGVVHDLTGRVRAILLLIRSELRGRPGSLAALAAILAVVSGVVAAGSVGSWRTNTVLDRFQEATRTSNVEVRALSPELGADPAKGLDLARVVGRLDGVRHVGVVAGFPLDIQDDYFMVYSSLDGSSLEDSDRPVLRSGRLPTGADEIAINRYAADSLDLSVGDRVRGPTLRPEDMETIFTSPEFPGFLGPELELEVVGVIQRGADLAGRGSATGPHAVASPEFAKRWGHSVGSYVTELRLDATKTSPALLNSITKATSSEVGEFEVQVQTTEEAWGADARDVYRTLAIAIAAFTGVAALAGLLVAFQAIGREVGMAARHDAVLRGLGMTRRARAAAAAGPTFAAIALGAIGGTVLAFAVSGRFPVGRARVAEIDPGTSFDLRVLIAAALIMAIAGGWALRSGWSLTRTTTGDPAPPSRISEALARVGARPSATVGVGMALNGGSGQTRLPVRSAILGAVVSIVAVVSIAVVGESAKSVAGSPSRYGWVWSSVPDDLSSDQEATARLAIETEGVDAIAYLGFTTVAIDGRPVPAAALEPISGSMAFTQIEGRQPTGAAEVAMTRQLVDQLDVEIGDTVPFDDPNGGKAQKLKLVGTIVGPPIDDIRRDAVFTSEGLTTLAQSEPAVYPAIRYASGTDPRAVQKRLERIGFRFTDSAKPTAPSRIEQMRVVRPLLISLEMLVAALGGAGLLHFLATTVRRRRGDLAVLRTLGFRRRDVRRSIIWQALATTVVGLLVGLPLGVLVGRAVWLSSVRSIGIIDRPAVPWWFLAIVVIAGLCGAGILAVVPGWTEARRSPVDTLRSE